MLASFYFLYIKLSSTQRKKTERKLINVETSWKRETHFSQVLIPLSNKIIINYFIITSLIKACCVLRFYPFQVVLQAAILTKQAKSCILYFPAGSVIKPKKNNENNPLDHI